MEEKKKQDFHLYNDIEIYNRESSEILQDIPQKLLHIGRYIIYGISSAIIIGAVIFKYSKKDVKESIAENQNGMVWITASKGGVVDSLLVKEKQHVNEGDTIVIIQEKKKDN